MALNRIEGAIMKENLKKISPVALYALCIVFLLLSRSYEEDVAWLYYCCLALGVFFFVLAGITIYLRNTA